MKIGLVCPYSLAKGGGVQEIVKAMQTELIKRGHEVKIITPQPKDISGIDTEGVLFLGTGNDLRSPMGTTSQVSSSNSNEEIEEALATEKFDILHFHEPWQPILSRQILSRSNAVNIATFHAKLPDTVMSKTIEKVITPYTKSILKYIDVMTAVSVPASEYVRQLTHKKINLISNGIDLSRYKPNPAAKLASPTIFFVGRLEKRKGVKYLLQAFALVQQQLPDALLIIGGDGPDRRKLELLAVELGLKNVEFLGYIDDEEKIRYMQSANVCCAPAIYGESFGIVLIEALACGTPVVAGGNPGYATVLTGRGTLGLVNPYDEVDFARRLLLHLEDPGLREFWREWSEEHVKQFDYEHVVNKYEALYIDALKEHRKK